MWIRVAIDGFGRIGAPLVPSGAERKVGFLNLSQKRLKLNIAFIFLNSEFMFGTKKVFEEIANSKAFSLAGGGHTTAALNELGLVDKISYVSIACGALTEFLMGK